MALILVVEDDSTMNQVLVETLQDEGHKIYSARDGKAGIVIGRNHHFDLAISDVRLPGIDGVETLTELKKNQPDLKCIVITGYASADTPVRAIDLQVDDYLFKPFSLTYFLNTVERVLDQEAEKEKKLGLFQKLFNVFAQSKTDALKELVAERQEAFRGLYLGSRSGYLSVNAAHEVYARLEGLEHLFRAHLNTEDVEVADVRALQGKYVALGDRISQLEFGGETDPETAAVPEKEFAALYEAIKSSHISLDDLQYAPLLRETPDERFGAHAKLLKLKAQLWPKS
jgi:DNA-binding response OmpR family regulator